LKDAQSKYPQLHIRVSNVADPAERTALFNRATESFPALNMLVNGESNKSFLVFTSSNFKK